MKGMMLTAGLGTRLRPVTDHYAKPAIPFLGVPLVHYPLALMREIGVDSLVLNTHYKAEQIEKLANELSTTHFQVTTSHESGAAPLGSGGGIAHAREHLTGDFLISNGDEVILPRRKGVMKDFFFAHQRDQSLATILVMRHPLVGTQFGGVWADIHGKVHGFGKNADAYPGCVGYHYIGLLLLNERVFRYLPEGESNILYDALTQAIAAGERVNVIVDGFTWFETGNPSDFLEATGDALKLAHSGAGVDAQILRAIVEP
jgi:mannose-1-phosphate guanylyltransferase